MKKALIVLLAVMLVVTMALALTACSPCKKGLHEWDEENAIVITPATCESKGEQQVSCSKCGASTTQEIEMSDHTWGNLIPEVAPSDCTHDGVAAHYQCSVCHKYFNEQKVEITAADLAISAQHTFGAWHDAQPGATCLVKGTVGYKQCSVCNLYFDASGNKLDSIEGEYGNHDFDTWNNPVAGDCQNESTLGYKDCKDCHQHFDANGNKLDSIIGTLGDHVWDEEVTAKAPTCALPGNIAYKHCEVCEKYYDEQGTELRQGEWVRNATGNHSWSDDHVDREATCELEGLKTVACGTCDATDQVSIPKKAHVWDQQHAAVEPDCVTGGNIAYNHCQTCGKYYDENDEVLSDGDWNLNPTGVHDYEGKVWTTDGNGKHYKECKVCGAEGKTEEPCTLEYFRDGSQHWQECTECTYKTVTSDHEPVDGECSACHALCTAFDVTPFEELYDLEGEEGKWFAIGKVKSWKDHASTATLVIEDEDGKVFQAYGLFNEDGTQAILNPSEKFAVGDVVVLYGGNISTYQSTKQMKGAWIVQVKGDQKTNVAKILLDETEVPTPVSKSFDLPTAEGKITWRVDSGIGITLEGGNHAKVTRSKTSDQTVVLEATAVVNSITATNLFCCSFYCCCN